MAIEQQRASEPIEQQGELVLDRRMIGPMGLLEPLLELLGRNRAAPQIAMLLSPGRHDPESAARTDRHSPAARTLDDCGVQFVLRAVAVDCGTRSTSDDGTASAFQRPPYQPVDQRILERGQRRMTGRCHLDQPIRIITAGVGHGQKDRQIATRLVDDG